jgi:hypothetical protein
VYVYVAVGVARQLPTTAVRILPAAGVPEIVGTSIFTGAPAIWSVVGDHKAITPAVLVRVSSTEM